MDDFLSPKLKQIYRDALFYLTSRFAACRLGGVVERVSCRSGRCF